MWNSFYLFCRNYNFFCLVKMMYSFNFNEQMCKYNKYKNCYIFLSGNKICHHFAYTKVIA